MKSQESKNVAKFVASMRAESCYMLELLCVRFCGIEVAINFKVYVI